MENISTKCGDIDALHAINDNQVSLLGLDFGSTTSSALVASAKVNISNATGRVEFSNISIKYRSKPVFTPFINQTIDVDSVSSLVHHWLKQSKVAIDAIFTGGSIITGLAAQATNATALSKVISQIVGDNIIAVADDPRLESWLAFMGNCSALSRYNASTNILNLDIGGGTSNIAIGSNGNVLETGCYFIGARHFQFKPGSYQLRSISEYGLALLKSLKFEVKIGDTLNTNQCNCLIAFYVKALESIVLNNQAYFDEPSAKLHCQFAIKIPNSLKPKITFSGGVGELLYKHVEGVKLPSTTFFGDFGIDLAKAIAKSTILSKDLNSFIPENKGRATLYGLTFHNTEISGNTIYLKNPRSLPLRNLPIIAKLAFNNTDHQWEQAFELASKHQIGACIQIINFNAQTDSQSINNIKLLANKIRFNFFNSYYEATKPLLILVENNIGKVLGNYISDWGQSMQNLIVIDEVPLRNAHFVNLGRMHQKLVPVSFFGIH